MQPMFENLLLAMYISTELLALGVSGDFYPKDI